MWELSGRHFAGRGAPVFGFDVQERFFRGGFVRYGRSQRHSDALFDGGLRHGAVHRHRPAFVQRLEVHRSRETHTSRLFSEPVRTVRYLFLFVDRCGSETLAASFFSSDGFSGSSGDARTSIFLHLVELIGTAERFSMHLSRAHAPGLFGNGGV